MRIRKIPRVEPKGKDRLVKGDINHYVAVDWSQSVMAIAHIGRGEETAEVFERPASVKELQAYLGSLRGRSILTFEESGSA